MQGRSQKSGDGGGKNLDRKPHLLINAKTGSNYYSVRLPANNTYYNEQRNVDELGVTVKSLEPAILLAGASQPSRTNGAIFPDAVYIIMRKPMYICNPPFSRQRRLSKQLKNGSSRPRASEAADKGKHAYPDGELQIVAENLLEGGASLRSQ